jgi:hypothetical protein
MTHHRYAVTNRNKTLLRAKRIIENKSHCIIKFIGSQKLKRYISTATAVLIRHSLKEQYKINCKMTWYKIIYSSENVITKKSYKMKTHTLKLNKISVTVY